jgi:peptide/nickel transport system substrate-binding protein
MTAKSALPVTRRTALGTGAALLAAPRVGRAQNSRVLRFVPQTDLAVLDPVFTTAAVTTNHSGMVFDYLYGLDGHCQLVCSIAALGRIA